MPPHEIGVTAESGVLAMTGQEEKPGQVDMTGAGGSMPKEYTVVPVPVGALKTTDGNELLSKPVQDLQGHQIGTLEKLIVDTFSGQIQYAILAIEDGTLRSYDGGWAEYIARRAEREAPPPPTEKPREPPKPKAQPVRRRPSELDRLESEIAAREQTIADLERKLAEDWADVETLTAHRRARDELKSLLERWEALFEASGSAT